MVEIFDIVDEQDNVIGQASRQEVHKKGLLHRVIDIFVLNSQGELLLQKRSEKKDTNPGLWTVSAGGHVDSGQTYLEAAHRELEEELGIKAELQEIGAFVSGDPNHSNQMIKMFTCVHDGPFNFNKEEIEEIEFVKIGKLKREIRLFTRKCTSTFQEGFRKFCEIKGI